MFFRAFDVYGGIVQTGVGLTPRETLLKLLNLAENKWDVETAFSLLDEMNRQNLISEELVLKDLLNWCYDKITIKPNYKANNA